MKKQQSVKKSNVLLVTADDVKRVKEILLKELGNIDPITKDEIRTPCLDHRHEKDQQVRGVISREINVLVGKIENTYNRNIRYWCSRDLPFLLRNIADYLEQEPLEIIHPDWRKKAMTAFNKLNSTSKDKVLMSFNVRIDKPNDKKRKDAFRILLGERTVTYGEVLDEIGESINAR